MSDIMSDINQSEQNTSQVNKRQKTIHSFFKSSSVRSEDLPDSPNHASNNVSRPISTDLPDSKVDSGPISVQDSKPDQGEKRWDFQTLDKPHQPRAYKFPKTEIGNSKRAFKAGWFDDFPWLHYDELNDKVFCHTCVTAEKKKHLEVARNKDGAFIHNGFNNWKNALERFREHQSSACHSIAVSAVITIPSTCQNISESLSQALKQDIETNRKILLEIIQNTQFLAKQGIAIQGNTDDSNFMQLFLLRAKDDLNMIDWSKKKTNKYTSHDIQNELINILALHVLRDISDNIKRDGFFSILADECTDISNKEQLAACIRHVDQQLSVSEDFLGFFNIPNINANTIVSAIKDVLLRFHISLSDCRGQCYDAGGPMAGCKNGVAVQILSEAPTAYFTHCYGHALSLAVHDMTKNCKLMSDAMDTTREICKLIKFSPKREGILNDIKKEINLDVPGLKVLCPTRWTVRGESFQRVLQNYEALICEWDICLDGKLDTEMRARIIGVKAQMDTFSFFFALMLGARLFTQTDNLSKTLQQSKLSALEGKRCAYLVAEVIESMRSDEMFIMFFTEVKEKSQKLHINDPKLFRHRRAPARYVPSSTPAYQPETVEDQYRHIYFEAIDLVLNAIRHRFDQPGAVAYMKIETLFLILVSQFRRHQH